MLTQIGKTGFFFLWENIVTFHILLLFFLELTVVTMQCNSCPFLTVPKKMLCTVSASIQRETLMTKEFKEPLG